MKPFISLLFSFVCLFFFTACDSHSWEDTYDADGKLVPGSKRLFEAHGSHDDHGDHDKHGDSHDKGHDAHDDHKEHGDSHDDHHAKEGH